MHARLPTVDGQRLAARARPVEATFTTRVDRRGEHPLVTVAAHGRTIVRDFEVRTVLDAARLGHLIADADPGECPTV
jgi:hypothetical protein